MYISSKQKEYLLENLALLIQSNMDLLLALHSIEEETKSKKTKKALRVIRDVIENGDPLWKALSAVGAFPEYAMSLTRIGEETGNLSKNMGIVSKQIIKDREFRSRLWSAMLYPIIVLVLAFGLSIGLAVFVLPKLANIFSGLEQDLPLSTKVIIQIGVFFENYGSIFVPAVLVCVFVIVFFLFIFPKTKFIGQNLVFKIPGIGNMIRQVEIGRMGFLLGTLLEAGVPIVQAMESMSNATQTKAYKKMYLQFAEDARDGLSFKQSFEKFKKTKSLLTIPVQNLIISGNASGKLAEALQQIGVVYEAKTDVTSRNLAVALEPIMLIVVWVVVLAIALSVILPIYSLIGYYGR